MTKRALISVSDKQGVVNLATELQNLGFEIISTGGTYNKLMEEGINVKNISELTGFAECLDGRVKTLHPKIHGGILAVRNNETHMRTLENLGIETIDLVVINLYPFKETIQKEGVTLPEAIENIDIGGPAMIRSSAKNYQDVVVLVNPSDYEITINELKFTGKISQETRFSLATKAFEHTAHYDSIIANYLRNKSENIVFPDTLTLSFEKVQDMRYGENPHQKAVFYKEVGDNTGLLTNSKQLHGKELSFNNINDTNSALELIKEFEEPTVVAIKHANPCGVGVSDNILKAYIKAYEADKISIFGGVIAANREIDEFTAYEINKIFVEIIIAPSFTDSALQILTQKKNIRILKLEDIGTKIPSKVYDLKKVIGGILIQDINNVVLDMDSLNYVTKAKPTPSQLSNLIFAMKVVKHTKSNGIVLCKDFMTVGIGAGQPNRITSLNIALECASFNANDSVMASDAFFPFTDCVEVAAKAGIKAIIQPGGSIKDKDSIEICDRYGIAMVFTGLRHFKH